VRLEINQLSLSEPTEYLKRTAPSGCRLRTVSWRGAHRWQRGWLTPTLEVVEPILIQLGDATSWPKLVKAHTVQLGNEIVAPSTLTDFGLSRVPDTEGGWP
jgi:hypothetical protein